MDLDHRQGARAAARYIQEHKSGNEPVVVCWPLFYFSMLYYAGDADGHYVYTDGSPILHYYGSAALIPEDLITDKELRAISSRRVFAVNMQGGQWGNHSVPVPPSWVEKSRRVFREAFTLGELIVIEYETTANVPRVN
jgi:hypothetical protein